MKTKILILSALFILPALFLIAKSAIAEEVFNNSVYTAPPLELMTASSTPQPQPDLFIPTDTSWKSSDIFYQNFEKFDFDDSAWGQAVDTSNYTYVIPWPGTKAIKSPLWNLGRLAYFRKTFDMPRSIQDIESAKIRIGVDDDYDLYLNNQLVVSDWDHYVDQSKYYDLKPFLRQGKNVIAIKASDYFCCHRSIVASIEIFFKAAPPLREPVILIPGIGASKNLDLMLEDVFSDKWSFTTNIYDGLIAALKAAGYEEGKTLFITYYDWRLPNAESATQYLKPLIEKAKQQSGQNKVNIIAHSMGGLVARNYIQSENYQNDVDKLIMLGAPNKGSSEAYLIWEGGNLPHDWSEYLKMAIRFYLWYRIHETNNSLTSVDVIRQEITSVRELLPLYNYLIDKNTGETKNYLEMNPENINNKLSNLNTGIADLLNKTILNQIIGQNIPTIKTIPVKTPSFIERKLGYWQDGKPDPINPVKDSNEGDNRVLKQSANINGATEYFLEVKHDTMPSETLEKIFQILETPKPEGNFASNDPEDILGIWVASPVNLTIISPSGKIISKNTNQFGDSAEYDSVSNPLGFKMITIENPEKGNYQIELNGIGNGNYLLATSYFSDNQENIQDTQGNIENGEEITYNVDLSNPEENIIITSEDIAPPELIDNLIKDIENYYKAGLIDNSGIKTSLVKKLENAKKNLKAPNVFQNFINEVQAQKDKHIFEETAIELLKKIEFIINNAR